MKDIQHGKIVFECDLCPETLETDTGEWSIAKATFDHEGWKAKQIAAEWVHGCPQHARSI